MSINSVVTVSQLNFYIKNLLEEDKNLKRVFLKGEISNFCDHYKTGHIYFSLKDEKSIIKAVMFSSSAKRLKFKPKEGMSVLICGKVSLYEASGQYQIYVEDMQPDGPGALNIAYEKLKKKLFSEGLFDEKLKKPIPKYPSKIGIITSASGAAFFDIKNILNRRFPLAEIVLCPTLVQGYEAPGEIVCAINLLNTKDDIDVIILTRGGGSPEDLWAFNDECVAYAIASSNIPIVSAVGHETDYSISDFVADLRAPTPSAAAELVVPNKDTVLCELNSHTSMLKNILSSKLQMYKTSLNIVCDKLSCICGNIIKDNTLVLSDIYNSIKTRIDVNLSDTEENLKNTIQKINMMNPLNIISRGYCVTLINNECIRSVKDVRPDDTITTIMGDGKINSLVISVQD